MNKYFQGMQNIILKKRSWEIHLRLHHITSLPSVNMPLLTVILIEKLFNFKKYGV